MPAKVEVSSGGKAESVFLTVVCVDFISNPLSPEFVARIPEYSNKNSPLFVENFSLLQRMPRNSMICRVVTKGKSKISGNKVIFPFFPPHFSLPVKPGEQVWALFEKLGDPNSPGYWMCRKSSDVDTDDINYTHLDRQNLYRSFRKNPSDKRPPGAPSAKQNFLGGGSANSTDRLFGFPAGGGRNSSNNTLSDTAGFGDIYGSALSTAQFVGEAVPRYSKRCADLTMQGSNNTLICLGTDRSGPFNGSSGTGAGSIDIVVGRGRTESTSPSTVLNSRKFYEVNKIPGFSKSGQANINEGDPDYENDSARVQLSMSTAGDSRFKTGMSDLMMGTSLVLGFVVTNKTGPFVGIRSKHIRASTSSGGDIRLSAPGSAGNTSLIMEGSTGQSQLFGGTMAAIGTSSSAVIAGPGVVGIVGALQMGPPPGFPTPPVVPDGTPSGIVATDSNPLNIGPDLLTLGTDNPYVRYEELNSILSDVLSDLSLLGAAFETLMGTAAPVFNITATSLPDYTTLRENMASTKIYGQ